MFLHFFTLFIKPNDFHIHISQNACSQKIHKNRLFFSTVTRVHPNNCARLLSFCCLSLFLHSDMHVCSILPTRDAATELFFQ